MEIIKSEVASIKHNDPEVYSRVLLSIAREIIDEVEIFFIITDSGEDCGPRFNTLIEAERAIYDMWGKSPEWDLQYTTDSEKMYMNIKTGSVDGYDGWNYTNEDDEEVNAVDLGEAVEVVKDQDGSWKEV